MIKLWRATEPTLSEHGCLELIEELGRLGLIVHEAEAKTIRLPNLLHEYARAKLGDSLTATHDRLLRAYNPTGAKWYTIPDDGYLYNALAYHLEAVGRRSEFATTVQDLRYIAARTLASKAPAVAYDIRVAIDFSPGHADSASARKILSADDPPAQPLHDAFRSGRHVDQPLAGDPGTERAESGAA